jgi:hypothetical protein
VAQLRSANQETSQAQQEIVALCETTLHYVKRHLIADYVKQQRQELMVTPNTYLVTVKQQGATVKQHEIFALDSLDACSTIEHLYGELVDSAKVLSANGKKVVNTSAWHGYCFEARRLS